MIIWHNDFRYLHIKTVENAEKYQQLKKTRYLKCITYRNWGDLSLYEFGTDEYINNILDLYSQTLIKLSYTYVKNICDAEDIAQDVFVALLKQKTPFESPEHEKAWLIRTTINKSKNHLKSGWVQRTVPLEESDMTESCSDEQSELLEAVLSLPEKYRTAIHLHYYDGYTINEIASIIKKKPATVGTWLARGRELLKNKLKGDFDDE